MYFRSKYTVNFHIWIKGKGCALMSSYRENVIFNSKLGKMKHVLPQKILDILPVVTSYYHK